MSNVVSVMSLLNSKGMSDKDILAVINPPLAERNRADLITDVRLPGHAAWRNSNSIGAVLDMNTNTIRSNHFRVDTTKLPGRIFHYAVHMYRYNMSGARGDEDIVPKEDNRNLTAILKSLLAKHPEWSKGPDGKRIGFTYNGKSFIFATSKLRFPDATSPDVHGEDVHFTNLDGSESSKRYFVKLSLVAELVVPPAGRQHWGAADQDLLNALDSALFSFARWTQDDDASKWIIQGSKLFQSNAEAYPLGPCYNALKGFYAGLKCSAAGLVFVSDMSVTCFLASGNLLMLMATCLNFRTIDVSPITLDS